MEDPIFSLGKPKKLGPTQSFLAGFLIIILACWMLCGAGIGLVRGKIPRLSTHSRSLLVRAETPGYYWTTVGVYIVLGATFGRCGLTLFRRASRERRAGRVTPPGF